MRIILLTSTSIRHAFIAQTLAKHFELVLTIREEKGLDVFYSQHPDREIIQNHFKRLADAEERFFKGTRWENISGQMLTIPRGTLNETSTIMEIQRSRPDYGVVFGCGIIKKSLFNALPNLILFNLHQGLSPYYRGSGTNFWPVVEGRFEYIGVTVHTIDPGIDTGGIIAHGRPTISQNDTLHIIGCNTIKVSTDLIVHILKQIEAGSHFAPIIQWDKGRLYRRADLTGEAIRKVYEREANDEVACFVEKRAQGLITPVRLVELSL